MDPFVTILFDSFQVALGDMKEVDSNLVVDPSEKYDSVKAVGHKQPDPSKSVFWKGTFISHSIFHIFVENIYRVFPLIRKNLDSEVN